MTQNAKTYIKFWPAYLAVFCLLYINGYGFAKGITTTGVTDKHSFSQNKFTQPETASSNGLFLKQQNSNSSLPEELPSTIEEKEENTNDNHDSATIIADLSDYGYSYLFSVTYSTYNTSHSVVSEFYSVPLYILFHSWKSYLA